MKAKTLKQRLADAVAKREKLNQRREQLANPNGAGGNTPTPEQVFGAPNVRSGESAVTSRGFSVIRLMKAISESSVGGVNSDAWDHAKVERDVAMQLKSAMGAGCGRSFEAGSVLAPFGTELLPDDMKNDPGFGRKIKSLMAGGVEGADPDEMKWLASRIPGAKGMGYKAAAQSWLDLTLGGALVGAPQMMELIDLFRNKAALTNAGASVISMPPSGRASWPRQTGASTGYWVGEGKTITGSNVTTGQLLLTAKKCGCLITLNNELVRFASPSAEALVRLDMTKTLALTFDQAGLEGLGGDLKPLGLINTPNVATVTPTTAASGNTGATLAAQDLYKFPSAIEENNAEFEGFIMRPSMYYAFLQRRAAAINAGDGEGLFLFSPFRNMSDNVAVKDINGFRCTTTAQVSQSRVQGSTTNLTYVIGGMWSDFIMAMFGAMEFAAATQGDTAFANDQTVIRAILIGDCGARHPGAFAWCDKVTIA